MRGRKVVHDPFHLKSLPTQSDQEDFDPTLFYAQMYRFTDKHADEYEINGIYTIDPSLAEHVEMQIAERIPEEHRDAVRYLSIPPQTSQSDPLAQRGYYGWSWGEKNGVKIKDSEAWSWPDLEKVDL
jgi:hypothetical protein